MTTPKPVYELVSNHNADEVSQLLETNGIDARVIKSTCGRTFIEADDYNEELNVVFGSAISLTPASRPKRKRGRNIGTVEIVEILNADGSAAEIAEATGYSISTVKRILPLGSPESLADTWRMGFLMHRLFDAGIIPDRSPKALWDFLPEDGVIGAVIGLHHWRKCKRAVHNMRSKLVSIADMEREAAAREREIAGIKLLNGSMERFIKSGGSLN
ncbi:hypothetical protein [Brevundimonas sp. NPDC058933]|uniref:hypothetical protein n=1 Tax=Brevundimonas sp. NPDC058933 TaxID=3346673 RepID=UPI003BEF08A5